MEDGKCNERNITSFHLDIALLVLHDHAMITGILP